MHNGADEHQRLGHSINLALNESKSVETVFRNPASKSKQTNEPPPTPMGITRKSEIKTLGVTLSQSFLMKTHVDNVITSCGQALYVMKILKSHGLPQECLHVLFQSTILSRLLYASQAWYGFASEEDLGRLDSFIRKSVKSSFASPDLPSFRQQCEKRDGILFESIRSNRNHVLAGLLPPVKETGYDLRTRAHDFVLPSAKTNKLVDTNFFHQVLFKNMY